MMGELHKMQRYVAECAGGEWEGTGEWSYNNKSVDAYHHAGLETFLSMQSTYVTLTPEELQDVSAALLWIVARPPVEGGLEGVAIRTRIREFARDCKEGA